MYTDRGMLRFAPRYGVDKYAMAGKEPNPRVDDVPRNLANTAWVNLGAPMQVRLGSRREQSKHSAASRLRPCSAAW